MSPSTAPKADAAQLIETIYAVAARPERWEEIIAAVGAAPEAVPEAHSALVNFRSLEDAALAAKPSLGVILLSPSGGVVGWNGSGEALFRDRLGVVESRGMRFFNPSKPWPTPAPDWPSPRPVRSSSSSSRPMMTILTSPTCRPSM